VEKPKRKLVTQSQLQKPKHRHPPPSPIRPNLTYHRIKCNVCSHPDRAAIDEAFLRWESPEKIVGQYAIAHRSSIYRHAHATGLYARRRRALSSSLEFIIEHAGRVVPTASEFFRAVKEYGQLGVQGERIVPSKPHVIALAADSRPETHSPTIPINRNIEEIESGATH
jgi:hypothetical protein